MKKLLFCLALSLGVVVAKAATTVESVNVTLDMDKVLVYPALTGAGVTAEILENVSVTSEQYYVNKSNTYLLYNNALDNQNWYGTNNSDKIDPAKKYYARITIFAKTGFVFSEGTTVVKVNGTDADVVEIGESIVVIFVQLTDGTTRIEEAGNGIPANGRTYNLQGSEVGDDYKGVVIKDGCVLLRK